MLSLDIALLSERGGRDYNEDACGHWQSPSQLCAVLADGAGGHGGGDLASRLAVQDLIARFAGQPSKEAAGLAGLLRQTNAALLGQREPGTPSADMHSTVVCLVLDLVARRAHWAHVGDSRLYWFRAGRQLARTRDHSLVQALVDAGMVEASQLRSHPKRSELRSALGLADEVLEISASDGSELVQAGDVFLLCTDGLWEYLDDALLASTLAAAPDPQAWLGMLSAEVHRLAAGKRSHDNLSALVVRVQGD